jgi:hypothetical protein
MRPYSPSPSVPTPGRRRSEIRTMELRLGEGGAAYEKRVGPLARKSFEGHIDLPTGAGVEDLDLLNRPAPNFKSVQY